MAASLTHTVYDASIYIKMHRYKCVYRQPHVAACENVSGLVSIMSPSLPQSALHTCRHCVHLLFAPLDLSATPPHACMRGRPDVLSVFWVVPRTFWCFLLSLSSITGIKMTFCFRLPVSCLHPGLFLLKPNMCVWFLHSFQNGVKRNPRLAEWQLCPPMCERKQDKRRDTEERADECVVGECWLLLHVQFIWFPLTRILLSTFQDGSCCEWRVTWDQRRLWQKIIVM